MSAESVLLIGSVVVAVIGLLSATEIFRRVGRDSDALKGNLDALQVRNRRIIERLRGEAEALLDAVELSVAASQRLGHIVDANVEDKLTEISEICQAMLNAFVSVLPSTEGDSRSAT